MTKIDFIHSWVIRIAPTSPDAAKQAIASAELAWHQLVLAGLGTTLPQPKAADKSSKKSFYDTLSPDSKVEFDMFWDFFNYKKGKEMAAQEWLRLGAIDRKLLEKIYTAAKREASLPLPAGRVRKMAQGWLSEKRWEDEHYEVRTEKPRTLSAVDRVRAANQPI